MSQGEQGNTPYLRHRVVASATAWQKAAKVGSDSVPDSRSPVPDRLLRVIPVAQTQTRGETMLTLLSLELFTGFFTLTYLIQAPFRAEGPRWKPDLDLSVSDDLGAAYAMSSGGGNGGTERGIRRYRYSYFFRDPLNPAARGVTVRLMGEHESAPWVFTVPLT